jgi:ribosome maturation factor RimP
MAQVHDKERELTREVSQTVEQGLPGVEVLAVELSGPERFTVYIDHPTGVDHALCERVTGLLRGYLDRYTVDVSSPGIERPLRTPAHFRNAVGRKVAIRTENDIAGRKKFRGTVADASQNELALEVADHQRVTIPYDVIVRGNLLDEGH